MYMSHSPSTTIEVTTIIETTASAVTTTKTAIIVTSSKERLGDNDLGENEASLTYGGAESVDTNKDERFTIRISVMVTATVIGIILTILFVRAYRFPPPDLDEVKGSGNTLTQQSTVVTIQQASDDDLDRLRSGGLSATEEESESSIQLKRSDANLVAQDEKSVEFARPISIASSNTEGTLVIREERRSEKNREAFEGDSGRMI